MDGSKKATVKLSREIDLRGGLHRRIFLKINITFNPLMPNVNKKVSHVNFLFFLNPSISFSKLELLLIHG